MWYFKPKTPGDTIREPVQGEFFAADAISDPGIALMREGIQNSLDAGLPGEKVLVRILVSGEDHAVPATDTAPYLQGAWEHFQSGNNGLRPNDVPSRNAPCPFLVFEDFGTTGLEGDPSEAFRSRTGAKNHFYHFFRSEGQSDKEASDRGIWGVGKQVFPRSSCVSTMFGVSARATDRRRTLMGRAILKSHYVGSAYCQDGYFGIHPGRDQHLVMPIIDSQEINRFCRLFNLERGTDPGLSIVVPWPDPEITDQAVIRAVLRDYFYPILAGQLEVIVETSSVKTVLDASTLIPEVTSIGGELAHELCPLLELADWARRMPEDDRIGLLMPRQDRAWQWSEELVPAAILATLRDAYQKGERLAFRVPVTVRPREGAPQPSYFDVYLVRDGTDHPGRSRNSGNPNYRATEDKRQGLYVEYLQVLADHRPAVFIMENVKSLLSATLEN